MFEESDEEASSDDEDDKEDEKDDVKMFEEDDDKDDKKNDEEASSDDEDNKDDDKDDDKDDVKMFEESDEDDKDGEKNDVNFFEEDDEKDDKKHDEDIFEENDEEDDMLPLNRLVLVGNNGSKFKIPGRYDNHLLEKVKERQNVAKDAVRRLSTQILTLFDNLISLRVLATTHQKSPEVQCRGTIDKDPGLKFPSIDESLSLPLDPLTLRRIIDKGHFDKAPFGKGSETILDLNTRDCWKMDIGKGVLIDPDFIPQSSVQPGSMLHTIKETLAPHLGLNSEIVAQPYQMLIYEKGGKFEPHRDTLRGANNIGSLVITLPVRGGAKGGDLVLSHETITNADGGSKIIHYPALDENDGVKWCAFYTDVVHEVKAVQEGYRVTLTFHLWAMSSIGQVPRSVKNPKISSLHELQKLQMVVGRAIMHWFKENDMNNHLKLIIVLDHQYCWKSLEFKRGRDHLLYECIKEALASTEIVHGNLQKQTVELDKDFANLRPDTVRENNSSSDSNISSDSNSNSSSSDSGVFKVKCSELSLHPFEKPQNGQLYDDIKLKRFELFAGDRVDLPVVNDIWLNRKHFIDMEKNSYSYEYNTGNEGEEEAFAYNCYCIEIFHSEYNKNHVYDWEYIDNGDY